MEPQEIRLRIRERLTSGELPRDHPQQTWVGYGTGQTCAVCGETIDREETEVEAQSADDKFRYYHGPCFQLLTEERFSRSRSGGPGLA